jgi:peptide/nickel transport system ATP-binding protein
VLEVRDLTVRFGDAAPVVDGASLAMLPGEVVAIVGESGSGKSLLARSVLNLLPPGAHVAGGSVRVDGHDMLGLSPRALRRVRGARVGMVFQEPLVSLNPALRVGDQLAEALRLHSDLSAAEIRDRSIAMLERVRVADPARCLKSFPHEFSGGMRQRIMIASVMLPRPRLLIADEPTTALDMIVQREVLDLMQELAREAGTAVLMISHDLALVAERAARVLVMHRARIVEQGPTGSILLQPRDDYTRRLLQALPQRAPARAAASDARALLELSHLRVRFPGPRSGLRRAAPVEAVRGVTLHVCPGETLAVVGESGSGKTTIARVLTQLAAPSAGTMLFEGRDTAAFGRAERQALRRSVQMVFQDPYSSLDPRMQLADIVAEPLRHDRTLGAQARRARAIALLEEAGIARELATRFPHQISGGQRQRVAIARAVITAPRLVVADEPVSALDATVQRQVLELLRQLQATHRFACVFVSHDLGVVESIADRVAVMHRGHVVELGPRDAIFDRPSHPYTRALLGASPRLEALAGGGFRLRQRDLSHGAPPAGRAYFDAAADVRDNPDLLEIGVEHRVACRPLPAAGVPPALRLVARVA